MNNTTRFIVFLGIAAFALAGGYFARLWLTDAQPAKDPAQVLLATQLPDLEGQRQGLGQWQGKVLVVNFWATWCPPCLKEIPEFVRMQDSYGAQGLQFIGIAIDDQAKVEAFVTSHRVNYPILMAGGADGLTLARDAGNRLGGLPFTVIIDRQGRTARVELGVLDEKKLLPMVKNLL